MDKIGENILVLSDSNGYPNSDTLFADSCEAITLDISNYPDVDLIQIHFSNRFYWVWVKGQEVLELSKKTLTNDPKSQKFSSFESGQTFEIFAAKSKDGTPYNVALIYGGRVKIE